MHRCISLAAMVLVLISLLSCTATTRVPYMKDDLASEYWVNLMDSHTNSWVALGGFSSSGSQSTYIKLGPINNINISGSYKVTLLGTSGENSATITGTQQAIKNIRVEQQGNTVYIAESASTLDVHDVVVTLRVRGFQNLTINGGVLVQGSGLHSSNSTFTYNGSGDVYLAGAFDVRRVINTGRGSFTVVGIDSSWIDINTSGAAGYTRLGGNYNIKSIRHTGNGNLILSGAYSDNLMIDAGGSGRIAISGQVNLGEVRARNNVWVMSDSVVSGLIRVIATDNAVVAMMGNVSTLYVETRQSARFFGRYLCADSAFIRTFDMSHVNISSRMRIFASASQNASIYYFGVPGIFSPFTLDHAIIIPFWTGGSPYCFAKPFNARREHLPTYNVRPRRVMQTHVMPMPPAQPDPKLQERSEFRGAG